MTIDWNVVATIAAPLIALFVGAALNRAIENRPRLVTYLGHASSHRFLQQDGSPGHVFAHSVVLRNSGRKSAENVRLSHSILPDFNIYPDVDHRAIDLPGGGKEIVIPHLVPGEQITISYLYVPPTTWNQINGPIKSDEGLAKVVQVLPTQQYPRWFNLLIQVLVIVGLITLLYGAYALVAHYAAA